MFRDAIRNFSENEIGPLVDEAEEKQKFPVQLFPRMGELGYLGVPPPGRVWSCGAGKDCRVHPGGENMPRMRRKQKYLVPAINGTKIAACALTEPNAGSDLLVMETAAKKDGDYHVLNGTKIFITNAPIADFIPVGCYTDKSLGQRVG